MKVNSATTNNNCESKKESSKKNHYIRNAVVGGLAADAFFVGAGTVGTAIAARKSEIPFKEAMRDAYREAIKKAGGKWKYFGLRAFGLLDVVVGCALVGAIVKHCSKNKKEK